MVREKAQVATTTRPKVPMHRTGTDCLVVAMKRARAVLGVVSRREGFGRDGKFFLELSIGGQDASFAALKADACARGGAIVPAHSQIRSSLGLKIAHLPQVALAEITPSNHRPMSGTWHDSEVPIRLDDVR